MNHDTEYVDSVDLTPIYYRVRRISETIGRKIQARMRLRCLGMYDIGSPGWSARRYRILMKRRVSRAAKDCIVNKYKRTINHAHAIQVAKFHGVEVIDLINYLGADLEGKTRNRKTRI